MIFYIVFINQLIYNDILNKFYNIVLIYYLLLVALIVIHIKIIYNLFKFLISITTNLVLLLMIVIFIFSPFLFMLFLRFLCFNIKKYNKVS